MNKSTGLRGGLGKIMKEVYDCGYRDGQGGNVPADLENFPLLFTQAVTHTIKTIKGGVSVDKEAMWEILQGENEINDPHRVMIRKGDLMQVENNVQEILRWK